MDYKAIFSTIQVYLLQISHALPLELFLFIGSFLEEIIAPIPSPFITTLSGSLAAAKNYPFYALFFLAALSSVGKTIGAFVIYKIADISEDIVLSRFGKFVGLSHTVIEKIGANFHKTGKDWFILSALRAIPIMPSAPISGVCGLIKMPMSTFIGATFIGNTIRNFIFLYFGYTGLSTYKDMVQGIENLESVIKILTLVGIVAGIIWVVLKRRKQQELE